MPKRIEGENANTLVDLAVSVIDELRNIRRFLLQPSTHPDWPALQCDMPAGLRALLDAVHQADQDRQQASERRYEAEGRLRQIEAEIERAGHQEAGADTLNPLRGSLDQATAELAAAQQAVDSAVRSWREAGRVLSNGENFNKMVAYELRKKESWLQEHREILRRRRDDLDKAIGGHRHHLDALPGRLGLRYDDRIHANSASLVLLRLAEVVHRDPHADLLNMDLEQLQLDATYELATLVSSRPRRQRSTPAPPSEPRRQKPTREIIDATAKMCLEDALGAARDAGVNHVPHREDVASVVSKALDYDISVASLFGTEAHRGGRRHRHPQFMELWGKVSSMRKSAREGRASRSRGGADSATDEET